MASVAKTLVGWREWVMLSELDKTPLQAKVDTGARTSALHATNINTILKNGVLWVSFRMGGAEATTPDENCYEYPIKDQRQVTNSGGQSELRYVIDTTINLHGHCFSGEITLTDRESMRFRMLLGRNVLKHRFLVDSGRSFLLGGNAKQPPTLG